ncbi:hypothetical protein D922_00224 [Enterococcus faecalis 06-MB-DW-09]|nr:hypothetical protein D922_00224 [Enterococcus faecalis 06-MB-DW-09]
MPHQPLDEKIRTKKRHLQSVFLHTTLLFFVRKTSVRTAGVAA